MKLRMPTFLGVQSADVGSLQSGGVAIVGASEATPYTAGTSSHSAAAPGAVRAAMDKFGAWHNHHDFDFGRPLLAEIAERVFDIGDISGDPSAPAANRSAITGTVRQVLKSELRPIVIGGDDSVQTPVLAAFKDFGPIWILQIDAHIDWRDERSGERLGWSSTMRRASEMDWVQGIVHVGIRGVGSARPRDVSDARDWGAHIVHAREIHERGIETALKHIPAGARCVICLDCDGLDPSVMPAVLAKAPGGLTYYQTLDLISGVAEKCELAGFNLVELVPDRDIDQLSALTAGRLVCAATHAMAVATRPSKPND